MAPTDPEQSVLRQLAPYLTMGIELAATVVVLFFLGRWLDGVLHTAPWCMVAAGMIGIGGSLYKFISTALQLGKKEDDRWKAGKHGEKDS